MTRLISRGRSKIGLANVRWKKKLMSVACQSEHLRVGNSMCFQQWSAARKLHFEGELGKEGWEGAGAGAGAGGVNGVK